MHKKIFLLCFLLILTTYAENAKNDNTVKPTETMKIIGQRFEKSVMDIPNAVYRIDEDEMRLTLQAPNLAKTLRRIPGVSIQNTGPGRSSPFLRGFPSSRNVVIADGVRLNNPVLREGPNEYWNLLDTYAYTKAEVILGPSSVIYGSDAIGGVVIVGTSSLKQGQAGAGAQWMGGDFYLSYASGQDSFSEHLRGMLAVDDRYTIQLGVTKQDFNDIRIGDGDRQPATDYEEWGAFFRAEFFLTADESLILGYDQYDQDNTNRVHKTPRLVPFNGIVPTGSTSNAFRIKDLDRRAAFAHYKMREGNGFISEADLNLSFQYMAESFRRIRDNGSTHSTNSWEDKTYGITLKLKSETGIGILTYGFDYYYDQVNSRSSRNAIQGVVADNATYYQLGFYIQDEIAVTERLSFVLGTRYSMASMNARDVIIAGARGKITGDWDALTSSAQFIYKLQEDGSVNLYGGISEGFRAPNLSDTTRNGEFGTAGVEAPTANLDPETFTSFELGLKVKKEKYDLTFSLYRTEIKNRILRLQGAKDNSDFGYIQGIELAGSVDIHKNFNLFGNIAWQEGYEQNFVGLTPGGTKKRFPMTKIPPLQGEAGVRWNDDSKKFWSEFVIAFAARQDHLAQNDVTDTTRVPAGGTPGYAVYHLRGGMKLNKSMDVSLGLENITDKAYRVHGSGTNEFGRSLSLLFHYKF